MPEENNLKSDTIDNDNNNPIPDDDKIINYSKESEKRMLKKQQELEEKRQLSKAKIKSREIMNCFHKNEVGDASIFTLLSKNKLVYDHSIRTWFYWNDHHWREDILDNSLKQTSIVCDTYDNEIRHIEKLNSTCKDSDTIKKNEKKIKSFRSRINSLNTINRKKNILKLTRTGIDSLGISGDQWDKNQLLLACPNGCVDLETGSFLPGNPTDYIKTICPIKFEDIDAVPKVWIETLHSIFGDDKEIIEYIQRLFGYGITGLTNEDIYPIFWGPDGRNGKSTIIEIIKYVFGEYAYKAPSEFMMIQKQGKSSGSPDAEMSALRGKRIVWCSETNKGDKLNVAKMKELSGSDTISTRPPYGKKQIEIRPSWLILLITNRKPNIPADDIAIWRRVHLIHFKYSFVENPTKENQKKIDKNLFKKLKKEAPSILSWFIRGCLKWQKSGLNPPLSILSATDEYKNDEDYLKMFLDECCVSGNSLYKCKTKLLFELYRNWCRDSGNTSFKKRDFLNAIRDRFQVIISNGNTAIGLGIKDEFIKNNDNLDDDINDNKI